MLLLRQRIGWHRLLVWLVGGFLLLVLVPTWAQVQPGVPLVSAETAAERDLRPLYQQAQNDFLVRLPAAESLRWNDWQDGGRPVEWSPANEAFWQRCTSDWTVCDAFLNRQMIALRRWLQQRSDQDQTSIEASVASLVADTCQRWSGPQSSTFEHCGLNKHLLEVALRWRNLGQDHLFVHYLRSYEAQRSQYLAWLANSGQAVSISTGRALPEVPAHVQAVASELHGDLAMARLLWLMTFGAMKDNKLVQRLALIHASRLSWRLGQSALATELAQSEKSDLSSPAADQKSIPCVLQHETWRMDLAQARAEGQFPTNARQKLHGLIAAGCPFTQGSIEWATDWLRETDLPSSDQKSVAESLADAITACQQGGLCPAPRLQRLAWLLALAEAPPTAHGGVAEQLQKNWPMWTGDTGVLDGDIQLAWAAAQRLMRSPVHRSEALKVADLALNALPGVATSNDASAVSAQDVANAVRYDPLVRTSARWQLQAGQAISPYGLEKHRAQSLMRRLRMAHLDAVLRDEKLPADEALRLDRRQAELLAEKKKLEAALEQTPGFAGLMDQLATDAMASLDRERLLAKARQRQQRLDPAQAKDWLRQSLGFDALQDLARSADRSAVQRWIGGSTASLGAAEAYLTWLEVPSGWVATVVGPRPTDSLWAYDEQKQKDAPNGVVRMLDGRPMASRFVAATPEVKSSLHRYRDMLLRGGANQRGAKVAGSGPAGDARVAQSPAELGGFLYRVLMEPFAAHIQGARQLTISPDGELTKLPFEALWTGSQQLVESMDIAYVQSLQVHAELKRRESEANNAQPAKVLSVSDPDYASSGPTSSPAAGARAQESWQQGLTWTPLPGTRRESQQIKTLFADTRVMSQGEATAARLNELSASGRLEAFRVLHFATHGYVDRNRSALVLTPNPGWAQAYLQDVDLLQWRLKSRLTLLSACDTGLGREAPGEGVMGLPYALMLAGNMNTMMSLWPVDDEGAATFVPAYLARLARGESMLAAFNQTKRDFIHGRHGEKMQDPRIWSTFVMYGVEGAL